jgi:NTE family protein
MLRRTNFRSASRSRRAATMATRSTAGETGETIALVLQGGGALGAYQAGAYAALDAAGYLPDWLAGISIGAINAAIIAGNPPARRVERLRTFWETVSSNLPVTFDLVEAAWAPFHHASAAATLTHGAPGFFTPRFPPPWLLPPRTATMSFYDSTPLRGTLEALVDFDLLNRGEPGPGRPRISVGAVNIQTGNFAYFDNARQRLGPEHIMASGALPPGLPPIEIDGQYYWDGGLISNTPLEYVLDTTAPGNLLAFQVDLFSAQGPLPDDLLEAAEREKDIRYSSRTRLNTDTAKRRRRARLAVERLLAKLPPEFADDPDAKYLEHLAAPGSLTIAHLIYRSKHVGTYAKDYEFSRLSIEEHWAAGVRDVEATLSDPGWASRPKGGDEIRIFDLARREPAPLDPNAPLRRPKGPKP